MNTNDKLTTLLKADEILKSMIKEHAELLPKLLTCFQADSDYIRDFSRAVNALSAVRFELGSKILAHKEALVKSMPKAEFKVSHMFEA